MAEGVTRDNNVLIEMRGICKRFGAVTALDHVNLTLRSGEVLGLVGDNGAGKSTLMKILSGAYQPDAGQILWQGKPVRFANPQDARNIGIEMVYQDLGLADNLSVVENIFLGREITKTYIKGIIRFVDFRAMAAKTHAHLNQLQINIPDIWQRIELLSGGQRQAVAIARATVFRARVVIMDEPTAALAIKEVHKVLNLVRSLKDHGVAVILISHRIDDIFQVCDRVMALYQGRNFAESPIESVQPNDVIGWIMGLSHAKPV
ncbi:ATP-binding cassette domain-containing protein [Thermorudis peleae]|uniref:ATP-binding cassette domain-containing protein n=1 Tax=Thermorudis peleae TaxID=1382356 RepID=UPI00056E026D|nr:ATP-binding cassette domain-containing protein [Thermorudis peleae]